MDFKTLTPGISVTQQITAQDVAEAAAQGYRALLSNRPDGEEPGQLRAADVAELASRHGMAFEHVPVVSGAITDADVAKMRVALGQLGSPVLAFCRTGTRSATLWALTQAGVMESRDILRATANAGYNLESLLPRLKGARASRASASRYDVVIVGGGSAGIATAASLLRRQHSLAVAVVEPSATHAYQPGWTMVGAGIFAPETTRRPMASVMPKEATWIRKAATAFAPETSEVVLEDGTAVRYRVLVAAPGLKLDWDAIPGLSEALGKNGVTSNYRYETAPYTRDTVRELKRGRALFTQPPMPIKCAGAPQKAMYLSCDLWRRTEILNDIEVEFHNAGTALFGVAAYVPALMAYVERYKIDLRFESRLVAVDGRARVATFQSKRSDGTSERIEREFDVLHAVPPQVAPDFVAKSPIAGETGYIAVDAATLRHVRYPNVFALGDACSTSNAKTMAAARKQAPIVAVNVLATLEGHEPIAHYDGYGSCPLTVERGKIVLAEFGYGGKLLPTFPTWLLDGTQPTRAAWLLKNRLLPSVYWQGMLKGREWLAQPRPMAQSDKSHAP
jgi:sulfide:quinone oxidoreductase